MDNNNTPLSRRQLLGATGSLSLVGLAGCIETTNSVAPPRTIDDRDAPLPDGAEECVSTMGEERDPDNVSAKDDVDYQFSPNYVGGSGFMEMCANCRFFCTGASLNAEVGACTVVEGGVRSQDWCALWQPVDGLEERERSRARHSE